MPRKKHQYTNIATILIFSTALTYFLSPGRQRYVHLVSSWLIQLNVFLLKWNLRDYQSLIADPYTATSSENTTRNKRDPLRMNSLENGILLCLSHHKAYDTMRFSIHPEVFPCLFLFFLPSLTFLLYQTHKIFSFHPTAAHLHGLEVDSPWKVGNPKYPAPHNELLRTHFQTSIFTSLSAAAEPSDGDELELSEISSNHDREAVSIWADDPYRYPPAEWRLDNEERGKSSPAV